MSGTGFSGEGGGGARTWIVTVIGPRGESESFAGIIGSTRRTTSDVAVEISMGAVVSVPAAARSSGRPSAITVEGEIVILPKRNGAGGEPTTFGLTTSVFRAKVR